MVKRLRIPCMATKMPPGCPGAEAWIVCKHAVAWDDA